MKERLQLSVILHFTWLETERGIQDIRHLTLELPDGHRFPVQDKDHEISTCIWSNGIYRKLAIPSKPRRRVR